MLDIRKSILLVVDIQEKFRQVIPDIDAVIRQSGRLIDAARELNVPMMLSEQYPQGLGHTVGELLNRLPPVEGDNKLVFEKTAFGCLGCDAIKYRLAWQERRQVILCGLETHVCVSQTAHQLLAEGYEVHLVTDVVSSRSAANHTMAITKMIQSGVIPTTTEIALFELMRDATHPAFRAVQSLIK
jgi:nicotinamidase-related amidase